VASSFRAALDYIGYIMMARAGGLIKKPALQSAPLGVATSCLVPKTVKGFALVVLHPIQFRRHPLTQIKRWRHFPLVSREIL
jgi:hypothetical protein